MQNTIQKPNIRALMSERLFTLNIAVPENKKSGTNRT